MWSLKTLIIIILIFIIIYLAYIRNRPVYPFIGEHPTEEDKDYLRENCPYVASLIDKKDILKNKVMYVKEKKVKTDKESKFEFKCRSILEDIYKTEFKSCYPDFLKNPESGHNLQLDGYNELLNIAFEANGKQHYEYPNYFHKTRQEFEEQIRRDNYKREVCEKLGIYLINIPYYVNDANLRDFILWFLPENYEDRIKWEEEYQAGKRALPSYVKRFYEG